MSTEYKVVLRNNIYGILQHAFESAYYKLYDGYYSLSIKTKDDLLIPTAPSAPTAPIKIPTPYIFEVCCTRSTPIMLFKESLWQYILECLIAFELECGWCQDKHTADANLSICLPYMFSAIISRVPEIGIERSKTPLFIEYDEIMDQPSPTIILFSICVNTLYIDFSNHSTHIASQAYSINNF